MPYTSEELFGDIAKQQPSATPEQQQAPFNTDLTRKTYTSEELFGDAYRKYQQELQDRNRTLSEVSGDTYKQAMKGLNTTAGALIGYFAPGSRPAKWLEENAKEWDARQSDVTKALAAAADKRIQEAAKNGFWDELTTTVKEYGADPILTNKIIVENIISFLPTLVAQKAAQGTAAAYGFAKDQAARIGLGTAAVSNAIQSGGDARGNSYEEHLKYYKKQGFSDEAAHSKAFDASRLEREIGSGIGLVTGHTGLEKVTAGMAGKGGLMSGARAFGAEMGGEIVEEATPQAVTNVRTEQPALKGVGHTIGQTIIASAPTSTITGLAATGGKLPSFRKTQSNPTPTIPAPVLNAPTVDDAIEESERHVDNNADLSVVSDDNNNLPSKNNSLPETNDQLSRADLSANADDNNDLSGTARRGMELEEEIAAEKARDQYGWPLPKVKVNSPFAPSRTINGLTRPHNGSDLGGAIGDPVATIGDGVVTFAGQQNGYGNVVIVEHPNGDVSKYAHLNDFSVKPGQRIARGDLIGGLGQTGNATGPNLHIELIPRGEAPVDYIAYMQGRNQPAAHDHEQDSAPGSEGIAQKPQAPENLGASNELTAGNDLVDLSRDEDELVDIESRDDKRRKHVALFELLQRLEQQEQQRNQEQVEATADATRAAETAMEGTSPVSDTGALLNQQIAAQQKSINDAAPAPGGAQTAQDAPQSDIPDTTGEGEGKGLKPLTGTPEAEINKLSLDELRTRTRELSARLDSMDPGDARRPAIEAEREQYRQAVGSKFREQLSARTSESRSDLSEPERTPVAAPMAEQLPVDDSKIEPQEIVDPGTMQNQPNLSDVEIRNVREQLPEISPSIMGKGYASGTAMRTATGRTTTPYPMVTLDTRQKAANSVKRVGEWLINNAIEEARSRGDRFNLRTFENVNLRNITPAEWDSAEEYLFGDEIPQVPEPFLKPFIEGSQPNKQQEQQKQQEPQESNAPKDAAPGQPQQQQPGNAEQPKTEAVDPISKMADSVTKLTESIDKLLNKQQDTAIKDNGKGKGKENGGTLQTESVPGADTKDNTGSGADRDRAGKSLDDGLAGTNERADPENAVRDSVSDEGGAGTADTGGTDATVSAPDQNGTAGDGRAESSAPIGGVDTHEITDEDSVGSGGLVKKFNDNIAAIKTLFLIEKEERSATPDERKKLARYVGFGALKSVFDSASKQWSKQYAELKALLNDAEYASARESTQNAHYTSKTVVDAMYLAVQRLGFTHGRILEPSVGSGNFFGMMPRSVRGKSKLFGVELDLLTSRLARAIYPEAVIAVSTGFEDYKVPHGYFDMAIGNPPFGKEGLTDSEGSEYSGHSIHNYFVAKMVDKVRDGGVIAVVVSHNFMDALNPRTREWIAKRANLIAAVRLPDTAFKGNAGTEVVTDILFFQKTSTPEKNPAWVNASDVQIKNKDGEFVTASVNDYLWENSQNILGEQSAQGSMYGPDQYTVKPNGDLKSQLEQFVSSLPENIYTSIERTTDELDSVDNTVPDGVKEGSYFIAENGSVRQRRGDIAGQKTSVEWVAPDATAALRMRGMIGIKNALRKQMRLELDQDATVDEVEANRVELNRLYDQFVKNFKYINSPRNFRIFLDDTESALLQSIEFNYVSPVTAKMAEEQGIEEKPESAEKADIMKARVFFPKPGTIQVSNAKDALLSSMDASGGVDMDHITSVYDKPEGEIIDELGNLIYRDPKTGEFELSETYLSGDVKTKLEEAERAAKENPEYRRNVEALEKVIPKDKLPSEIHAPIGAGWIPADIIKDFVQEIAGSKDAEVIYVPAIARWQVVLNRGGDPALMRSSYGTPDMHSVEIFDGLMNGQPPVIMRTDENKRRYVDEQATQLARSKADEIIRHWENWIWVDAKRADTLSGIFNRRYNRIVTRKYDGKHLQLHGKTPNITLHRSQINVIWRAIQERTVLLDHVVGAGKTFAVVATVMELKRLGIVRKPLIVVPNHIIMQWRTDFARLYPAANVLAASPQDISQKDRRERLFAKIALGEYDAVIIGHSSLKKIGMDPEIEGRIYQEQIDDISEAIEELKRSRNERGIVSSMEKLRKRLKEKLKALVDKAGEKDKAVQFNELGVDGLVIDELHEFKNLFYVTSMTRVAGLGNQKGSGKAFDLFAKIRWMRAAFGDKAPIIGATGTPVSNSLAELYTMQRFMQYDRMKADGIASFDAWASLYGSVESVYEVKPSGVGFRIGTRFAKFKNLPTLVNTYQSFADTITLADLKEAAQIQGKKFPVPRIKGGKPQNIVAKRSPLQTEFFGVPKIQRDRENRFAFSLDPEHAVITQNDSGKWRLHRKYTRHDGKVQEYALGSFDTEREAREKLVELVLTPELNLDPETLLGKFERVAELTRSTKGKVNALSLTTLSNKAGLDMRIINPDLPDFEGSKINLAVKNVLRIYKDWSKDKGTQLIFCDSSVPLSARTGLASKARRVFVRDTETGELTHKQGTLHTVTDFEGYPYYLVKSGTKEKARIAVYDAYTGALIKDTFFDRGEANRAIESALRSKDGTEQWNLLRDRNEPITEEMIAEYREENDLTVNEDGSNEIQAADVESVVSAADFSVYDDVKAKLIAGGIPDHEIAFIHDYDTPAKKHALFRRVNSGEIRVLLGSTPKMGAGTNVQERMVALHHLDAPYKPSELEQREGRIIRQENKLYERDPDGFEVEILRYGTEQTYDTRRWQLLEHKASGSEQLRHYTGADEIDDVVSEAANSADMKAAASGNPLILTETRLRNEVKRLTAMRSGHFDSLRRLNSEYESLQRDTDIHIPQEIHRLQKLIAATEAKIKDEKRINSIEVTSTVDFKPITTKAEAEKYLPILYDVVADQKFEGRSLTFEYRGLVFIFSRETFLRPSVHIKAQNIGADSTRSVTSYNSIRQKDDPKEYEFSASGMIQRLDNFIERLPGMVEDAERKKASNREKADNLKPELQKPFQFADELAKNMRMHDVVKRRLMQSTQLEAVAPEERAEFETEMEGRKEELRNLGYAEEVQAVTNPLDVDEVSFSKSESKSETRGDGEAHTVESARAAILESVTGKDRETVQAMLDNGSMKVISAQEATAIIGDDAVNPDTGGLPLAFYNPADKTSYFIADHIPANHPKMRGLALHEIGVHAHALGKNDKEFQSILRQVEMMVKTGNEAAKAARDRVPDDTHPSDINEETLGYLVEDHPELNIVQKFLAWLRNAIRQIGAKYPDAMKLRVFKWAGTLNEKDLVFMAHAGLRSGRMPQGNGGVKFMGDSTRFSKKTDPLTRATNIIKSMGRPVQPAPTTGGVDGKKPKSAGSNKDKPAPFDAGRPLGVFQKFFSRNSLVQMYRDTVIGKGLAEYKRLREQATADTNNLYEKAEKFLVDLRLLPLEVRSDFATIAHEATLYNVDPTQARYAPSEQIKAMMDYLASGKGPEGLNNRISRHIKETQKAYNRLRKMYLDLPDTELRPGVTAKTVFSGLRQRYVDQTTLLFKEFESRIQRTSLEQSVKDAAIQKSRDQLKALMDRVYFPLYRAGDFIVHATKKGEPDSVEYFETQKAMEERVRMLEDEGYTVTTDKRVVSSQNMRTARAMGEVRKLVNNAVHNATEFGDMTDLLLLMDDIDQTILRSMPDASYKKTFIHRKGTRGYSEDFIRAYASAMRKSSIHISSLRHNDRVISTIEDMRHAIKTAPKGSRKEALTEVVNGIERREEFIKLPTSKLASRSGKLAFLWMLGSASNFILNATQTWIFTMPYLGSEYGYTKANLEISRAYGMQMRSVHKAANRQALAYMMDMRSKLSGVELDIFNRLHDAGKIDLTQAFDLIDAANESSDNETLKDIMRFGALPQHLSEVMNRQVSMLAAIRLEMARSGDKDAAYDAAKAAVDDTHFDYSKENRAEILSGDTAQVLFKFKQYAQNAMTLWARTAMLSMSGSTTKDSNGNPVKKGTPSERARARKMLAGMMGTQFLAAGILGLPIFADSAIVASGIAGYKLGGERGAFAGIAGALVVMTALLFGDDDGEDLDIEIKKFLVNAVGKDAADTMARGVLPIGLATRLDASDLIFRRPDPSSTRGGALEQYGTALLGPIVGGIGGEAVKAVFDVSRGDTAEGLQRLIPVKQLRDMAQAWKWIADDMRVLNTSGQVVTEVDRADIFFKSMGINPSVVAENREYLRAQRLLDQGLTERRRRVMQEIVGNPKDAKKWLSKVSEYNKNVPAGYAISAKDIRGALRRDARNDGADATVTTSRKRQQSLDEELGILDPGKD